MNVSKIIESNRCLGCGLCKSVCPIDAIELSYSESVGVYQPIINKDKCIQCGKCLKFCGAPLICEKKDDSLTGFILESYLAHAKDDNVRNGSTSGGVINRLVYYLISTGNVEAAVMAVHDSMSPIETSCHVITKENLEVLNNRPREYASRYVTVPILENIQQYLEMYKSIAVVGTPCQIKALSKLNYKDKILLKIGITCSGGMSYLATDEYKRKMKHRNGQMFYRGLGWPGKNSLYEGSMEVSYDHQGSYFERMFSSQIFKNKGCRLCLDHFAEDADISFCDFWNSEEMKTEHKGNSCVLVRNAFAKSIFENMIESGIVEIKRVLAQEEVIKSQLTVLKVKKGTVKKSAPYKLFMFLIDTIQFTKIYRIFNFKIYRKIAEVYFNICRNGKVGDDRYDA